MSAHNQACSTFFDCFKFNGASLFSEWQHIRLNQIKLNSHAKNETTSPFNSNSILFNC